MLCVYRQYLHIYGPKPFQLYKQDIPCSLKSHVYWFTSSLKLYVYVVGKKSSKTSGNKCLPICKTRESTGRAR